MGSSDRWTIRRTVPSDLCELVELWERSVRSSHDFLSERDIAALRPEVERELASIDYEWWALTDTAGQLAGFMAVAGHRLEALFVDPSWQGQGVGRALVGHALTRCGPVGMTVDVNAQNAQARRFYASLGFEEIGSSPTDDAGRPFPLVHLKRPRTS